MKRLNQLLLALGLVLLSGATLTAAPSTWDGDTDSFWTTLGNWDTAPTGGEDIVFPSVANQTVDLNATAPSIGTLTFNSPNAYSLANGGPGLTLGGDVSQNGAGTVDLNVAVDLGGASRNFGGSGSGVVNLNGPVTDAAATGNRVRFTAGNWVITNSANTVDRFTAGSGATVTVAGSVASVPMYPNSWYLGGNGTSGGFYGAVDGGTLKIEATQPVAETFTPLTPTVDSSIDWYDRGFVYGASGGTLVFNTAPPMSSPRVWYSQGGTGTLVVGEPLPYSGDPWAPNVGAPTDGTNQFRSPFEVEYGVGLGIFNLSGYTYSPPAPTWYKWRQGSGDLQVILTNGACAYLDWAVMTNGNLIIRGHPGGDSSVIETNATGWTRNVGRFAIRGPHRDDTEQYSVLTAADAPAWAQAGVILRSFYMDQPYGMVFYDAVQVWNRDGMERLACDMTFEAGSSVDFCSGRRSQQLDLGHPGNSVDPGPTNLITIKDGGKLNLNLQMRSNLGDGLACPLGMSAGLRVWSSIDIKDGGQLKIYRSQTNCLGLTEQGAGDTTGNATRLATKCIELFRPIIGSGGTVNDARVVIDLPYSERSRLDKSSGNSRGNNGVNWEARPGTGMLGGYPGALPIVNGSSRYGLRIEGKGEYLADFLNTVRYDSGVNALTGLTGSGGVLTLAATDTSGSMTISDGPASNPNSVRLGFIGNLGFTYVLNAGTVANFGGLLVKQGRVKLGNGLDMTGKNLRVGDEGAAAVALDDASTVTMNQLVLIGDTSLEMGTAGGSAAVMNFASTASAPWTAGKTLTIQNWNGNPAGGGPDQIFFGTDATGLTVAQLAQIQWTAPNGGADVIGAKILSTGEIVPPVTLITSPSIINGEFVFSVVPADVAQTSVIQWATNLTPTVNWYPVLTNTGAFNFTNTLPYPEAFYRVLVP